MKYAILKNSIVENVVVADPDYAREKGFVELIGDASIGWRYSKGKFYPPEKDSFDYSAQNKTEAMSLLQATDWVEVPSVSNTANTPHLINYQEFITYRLAVRSIAVNPPTEPATFPTKPEENWSSV